MRAAVLERPQSVSVQRVEKPEPSAGRVVVRLHGSGICGSELPVWQGRSWFRYPLSPGAPGHEGWGVVEAAGDDVADVNVGDTVALLSERAHAEFDVADATSVIPLPESLVGQLFPGEALGCAMNVFARSGINRGDVVAVVGIGFLGALLVQLAARAGASVVAVSRRPFALEVATAMGAQTLIQMGDSDETVRRVAAAAGSELCDRVIEAAGAQQALEVAAALTRVRGRLIIAGYHQDGPRSVDMQLWNWRGLDVINAHERDPAVYVSGIRAAAEAVAAGSLDPALLYTHSFDLDRAADAFRTAAERPDGFLKALVTA